MQPTTSTRVPAELPTSTARIGRPCQERPSSTARAEAAALGVHTAKSDATRTRNLTLGSMQERTTSLTKVADPPRRRARELGGAPRSYPKDYPDLLAAAALAATAP